MIPADAAKVLTLAAVYDNRTFDDATCRAWADALTGFELTDCLDAVRVYYRQSKEWLMPADLRSFARTILRDRLEAERQAAELEAAPADPDHVARMVDMVREAAENHFKIPAEKSPHPPQDRELQRKARKVACPWCKVPAKSSCVNTATGRPSVTHEARLIAAGILEPAS